MVKILAKLQDNISFLETVILSSVTFSVLRIRCSGIKSKLREYSKFKCKACESQQADIEKDCSNIKSNNQPIEIVEKKF